MKQRTKFIIVVMLIVIAASIKRMDQEVSVYTPKGSDKEYVDYVPEFIIDIYEKEFDIGVQDGE
jgi:hypothetical protein